MERLNGRDIIRATEATEDDEGVQWITILKEGTSENNRRYRRDTLERAVTDRVYENIRMFVDHSDGPPLKRSMRDLVSAITDVKLDTSFPDGKARVRGAVKWIDDDWQKKIGNAKEHIGVSHDALLRGTRSVRNGRRFEDIDEIVRGNSVDWVIYPSAGGGFENSFLAKEGVEMEKAIDWDAIDEEMLKKHKPDLYKSLRGQEAEADDDDEDEDEDEDAEEAPASRAKESKKKVRKVTKIKRSVLENQIGEIVKRAFEAAEEKRSTVRTNHQKVEELVNKSTLPDLTKKRVIRSFESVEEFDEDSVKEAIKEAKAEVAAIGGPRIRGAGPSGAAKGGKPGLGRAHEALETAFSRGLKRKVTLGGAVAVKTKKSKQSDDEDEDDEEEE